MHEIGVVCRYPDLERFDFFFGECIRFGNDGNEIDSRRQSFHEFYV